MKRFFAVLLTAAAVSTGSAAVTLLWSRPDSEPATRSINYQVYQWGDTWTNPVVVFPGTTQTNLTTKLETKAGTNYFQVTAAWTDLPSIEGPPSNVLSYVSDVFQVPPPAPATNLSTFAYSPQGLTKWTHWVQWVPSTTNTLAYDVVVAGTTNRVSGRNLQIQNLPNDVPILVSVFAIDRWGQVSSPISLQTTHSAKPLAAGAVTYTLQTLPK